MLVHLHVKNLALIDEIEVEFGPGLNILTGETGAGKSILLGSMQLILGGKTSRSMIRENAPYALVELLFQVENTKAKEALAALDIYPEDGQILMSRKIMDGRSINKINGETSTVSQMKAAAACLLDIHGQHEHQSLLYEEKQLEILDAYGREKIFPEKEKVKAAYQEYKKCQAELKSLDMDEEQKNRKWLFWNLRSMRLRKHLWFQEKTKNWKSNIESSPMDAELSIPCKVPMPLPDMMDRELGKQWERLFGSFPE